MFQKTLGSTYGSGRNQQAEDYIFAAHARTDIPVLVKLVRELMHLCEKLKLEAQFHSQEARTANATIYEIYQIISRRKGEPGNWNGAEPVRKAFNELQSGVPQEEKQ